MATKKPKAKSVPAPSTPLPAPPPEPQWVENGSGHQHDWRLVGMLREGEATEFCSICSEVRKV